MATGDAVGAVWGMNIFEGVIPGVGPAVTAGMLRDLLSRNGTGTAMAGIGGALIRLGISETDACRCNEAYGHGRSIVTVRDRRTAEARSIFDQFGAIEKSSHVSASFCPLARQRFLLNRKADGLRSPLIRTTGEEATARSLRFGPAASRRFRTASPPRSSRCDTAQRGQGSSPELALKSDALTPLSCGPYHLAA